MNKLAGIGFVLVILLGSAGTLPAQGPPPPPPQQEPPPQPVPSATVLAPADGQAFHLYDDMTLTSQHSAVFSSMGDKVALPVDCWVQGGHWHTAPGGTPDEHTAPAAYRLLTHTTITLTPLPLPFSTVYNLIGGQGGYSANAWTQATARNSIGLVPAAASDAHNFTITSD